MNGHIDVVHPVVVGTTSIAAEESNVMPPSTFGKMISHAHAAVTHISDLATGSICCIFCSYMPVMVRTPTREAISFFKVLNKKDCHLLLAPIILQFNICFFTLSNANQLS